MCYRLCPFQGISRCVGGNGHHGNSFSHIRKEKLCLAKTRCPCERWAQHLPRGKDLVVSPPEWHQAFDHPCLSLQTYMLQSYEGSKLWSSLVPSATFMKVPQQFGLQSRAPTSGLISPSPRRWLRLGRVFSRSLCSFWKGFQGRRHAGRAKRSSHENLSDRGEVLVAWARIFSYRVEQG